MSFNNKDSVILIRGDFNTAKVFSDKIEETAISQIKELCNQKFIKGSKIRIMPDVHAGVGCTIGTTLTIEDKLVPNLVGVDIGCGIAVYKLKEKFIDFAKLDRIIKEHIPSGFNIRERPHPYANNIQFSLFLCINSINVNREQLSLGTLGGGNHFIEVDKDPEENFYLVIHSGSRHLGVQVAKHYQKLAYKTLRMPDISSIIETLKSQGKFSEIETTLNKIKSETKHIKKELAYLEGENFDNYIHDMRIAQHYANYNRKAIAETIIRFMNFNVVEHFTTVHNYIDVNKMILRKGAVSAQKGERLIIPMNMRDGSIIAIGKGNPEWNYSAPHGAGRIMSRRKARETIKLDDFRNTMDGIYTTCVNADTIDESPMVYKSVDSIVKYIKDTVDILNIITPVYNFKANS